MSMLVIAAGCGRDPRQVLVQLDVPYTTAAWVGQAGAGDRTAVAAFLAAGMDPNTRDGDGHSALMNAAAGGHVAVVRTLLDNRAEVDVTSRRGMAPLAAAIIFERRGQPLLTAALPTPPRHAD
jgi:ankyrin repeat protein